ncbi:MAG: futalosine hydrolase [Bacteroidia bacterium]|nr:futalosine hydrolase [Bacteroidia bacterium]
MKLLIVSATVNEIQPFAQTLEPGSCKHSHLCSYSKGKHSIDILITGIGPVFTTYHLTKTLLDHSYDFIINAGICGSFSTELQIGDVVEVTCEEFSDHGIEDTQGFFTVFEKKLADSDTFPFRNGRLMNESNAGMPSFHLLKKVSGITSAMAHGNEISIALMREKFNADVESMEGAAFFLVCIPEGLPFMEIRAVSNYIEPRNEKNWNIPLAIAKLNSCLGNIVENMSYEL